MTEGRPFTQRSYLRNFFWKIQGSRSVFTCLRKDGVVKSQFFSLTTWTYCSSAFLVSCVIGSGVFYFQACFHLLFWFDFQKQCLNAFVFHTWNLLEFHPASYVLFSIWGHLLSGESWVPDNICEVIVSIATEAMFRFYLHVPMKVFCHRLELSTSLNQIEVVVKFCSP